MPYNDHARPYVLYMLNAALVVVKSDNEKNAIVAMRIVLALIKAYVKYLDKFSGKVLEIVTELYKFQCKRMAKVRKVAEGPKPGKHSREPGVIPGSVGSYAVLGECPSVIVFILTVYRKYTSQSCLSCCHF